MSNLTFEQFQQQSNKTVKKHESTKDAILDAILGLNGEVGEVTEVIKKHLYHNKGTLKEVQTKLCEELGDVLWYLQNLATTCGISLEVIAELNLEKLQKRYPEGYSHEQSKQGRNDIR